MSNVSKKARFSESRSDPVRMCCCELFLLAYVRLSIFVCFLFLFQPSCLLRAAVIRQESSGRYVVYLVHDVIINY